MTRILGTGFCNKFLIKLSKSPIKILKLLIKSFGKVSKELENKGKWF